MKEKKSETIEADINQEFELENQRRLARRTANCTKFKMQFPECAHLSKESILYIFQVYRQHCGRDFTPCNFTLVVAGTLQILFSSLFLNGGALGDLSEQKEDNMPNAIVMNTVIASATSGLTFMIINQVNNVFFREYTIQKSGMVQNFDVSQLCNAILAGMVSITASCNNVQLWASCVIGLVGCVIYMQTKKLLDKFEIDDPLDSTQIHGLCGFWAIIAVGVFDKDIGLFITGSAAGISIQMLGALIITIWTLTLSFFFFYTIKQQNRLRISVISEIIGIDF